LFFMERLQHLMRTRGLGHEEVQVVTGGGAERVVAISVEDLIEWAHEWGRGKGTPVFEAIAEAYKRAKKIVEAEWSGADDRLPRQAQDTVLRDPAEVQLRQELDRLDEGLRVALGSGQPRKAMEAIASIQPTVARFFDEVRVVVPDRSLKIARLSLLSDLRDTVAHFGDPSYLTAAPE
jgi:glycyl-tRNA synthetase beta chain